MSEKGVGLIAGIIAVAGVVYLILLPKTEERESILTKDIAKVVEDNTHFLNDLIDKSSIRDERFLQNLDDARDLVDTTQNKITGALGKLADMKNITDRMLESRDEPIGTLTGLQNTLDILKDATGMDVDMDTAIANLKAGMDPLAALESAQKTVFNIVDTVVTKTGLTRR